MKPRKQELAEWGEFALQQVRGPLAARVRRKLWQWRDPRSRLLRQRRRAKRDTTGSAVTTGVLGAGAAGSAFAEPLWSAAGPLGEAAQYVTTFGLGGLAVATGAVTVGFGLKYRRLMRTPLPAAAPEPVELPPHDSHAYEPMRRLRDAELSLHGSLAQLEHVAAGEWVSDARSTASGAAEALRRVAERLRAVEVAIPHASASTGADLESDARRLKAELDAGVDGFGDLVAAAGRAVAASAEHERNFREDLVQDATDRLAGLAAGLREISGNSDQGRASLLSEESPTQGDLPHDPGSSSPGRRENPR